LRQAFRRQIVRDVAFNLFLEQFAVERGIPAVQLMRKPNRLKPVLPKPPAGPAYERQRGNSAKALSR
jgi:hypothetical protein